MRIFEHKKPEKYVKMSKTKINFYRDFQKGLNETLEEMDAKPNNN